MTANVYGVFTLDYGVIRGATVGTFTLKNGTEIPAITVGEIGRGRSLGVLSVQLPRDLYTEWKEKGQVRVCAGKIGKTESGNFKLFAESEATADEKIIAVMPTKIGYRGGNSHTGDREGTGYQLTYSGRERFLDSRSNIQLEGLDVHVGSLVAKTFNYQDFTPEERDFLIKACGLSQTQFEERVQYRDFPGEILVKGMIAQGAAGGMGSGTQMIALIPKGIWFRTGYSGRLYGGPSSHYYIWDGQEMNCLTWEERKILEATEEIEEVEWL